MRRKFDSSNCIFMPENLPKRCCHFSQIPNSNFLINRTCCYLLDIFIEITGQNLSIMSWNISNRILLCDIPDLEQTVSSTRSKQFFTNFQYFFLWLILGWMPGGLICTTLMPEKLVYSYSLGKICQIYDSINSWGQTQVLKLIEISKLVPYSCGWTLYNMPHPYDLWQCELAAFY